ncbi:MAG: tRNA epoxyqueuosine(34) reductase QueG, partial [Alphaproteobacteria bacterium]
MSPLKANISQQALALGFDTLGFADPSAISHTGHDLQQFLTLGYHGDMEWMERNADRRGDPGALWPQAKSAIVVGHNYGPETNPMQKLACKDAGNISCYAQNQDYHDVMKKKLRRLARWLAETYGCEVKLFVDTAPVMEKPLAQAAGLGWQGKHTCLVSREYGSWLFIGSIFTTMQIPPDKTETDHCGSCTACLDICPTAAFIAPHQLDARRCISY